MAIAMLPVGWMHGGTRHIASSAVIEVGEKGCARE